MGRKESNQTNKNKRISKTNTFSPGLEHAKGDNRAYNFIFFIVYRYLKTGDGEGVQANPIWIRHCACVIFITDEEAEYVSSYLLPDLIFISIVLLSKYFTYKLSSVCSRTVV